MSDNDEGHVRESAPVEPVAAAPAPTAVIDHSSATSAAGVVAQRYKEEQECKRLIAEQERLRAELAELARSVVVLSRLTDVERSNATARDHAHAALHGSARAEGSPAGEHAPALDADGRRDGLRGNQIYGAFVLNRRVDLHAIDATPAR